MKRKLLLLLLLNSLFLFQSCHVQIENNRRIQIKGKVVDSNGNPVPDIVVRMEVEDYILGSAVSEPSGKFNFISLDSHGYDERITINLEKFEDGIISYDYNGLRALENSAYSGKLYYNIPENNEDLVYDLGTIQLNPTAVFILQLKNIPGDTNTLSYRIDYTLPICQISLTDTGFEDFCNNYFDDYFEILESNSPDKEISHKTQLGTEITITYSLNDGPEETITIPVNQTETTYVFEY